MIHIPLATRCVFPDGSNKGKKAHATTLHDFNSSSPLASGYNSFILLLNIYLHGVAFMSDSGLSEMNQKMNKNQWGNSAFVGVNSLGDYGGCGYEDF